MNTFSRLALCMSAITVLGSLQGCKSSGGTETVSKTAPITAVRVIGDSLADSGTFGYKFTVQGSTATGTGSTPIWPELVAANLNQSTLCNYFQATSLSSFVVTSPNCTSYATGGARINMGGAAALQTISTGITSPELVQAAATVASNTPLALPFQIKIMASNGLDTHDVILVDGGGNDAADLIDAYLFSAYGSQAVQATATTAAIPAQAPSPVLFNTLLSTLQMTPGSNSNADALAYMQKLAGLFADTLTSSLPATGDYRVVILNMPTVSNTPKLVTALNSIASGIKQQAIAQGASEAEATTLGENTRARLAGQFDSWVAAFNTRLSTHLASNSTFIVVDFASAFSQQVNMPAQFGLDNVTTPVCPISSLTATGPQYDLKTCTASYLAGREHWGFADNLHPTPYGHTLIASLIALQLAQGNVL